VRSSGRSIDASLPDLIDRFAVAASAGLGPAASLTAVAQRAPEPLAGPLVHAAAQLRAGLPFERCLDQLEASLGPASAGLVGALRDAADRGVPLVPLLQVVGREARDVRRRQVQVRARRLPVALLFPLVLCTLPAAVLVTVVPIVAVALRSLSL
jgi:tight adherence protein C